jgi:hypothetical protein
MPVSRVLIAAAAALLAACAPVPPPADPAPQPSAAAADALVSSLSVETLGDTVRLSLQVTNATDAPLALVFPSGQTYDFAVMRGGETLWHWSADKSWMQAVREETVPAGETRTYSEAWVPGAPARGELSARAWLTSSSHPLERTATFRLP